MFYLQSVTVFCSFCFFNDTATTEIYTYLHTLSLLAALPIYPADQPDVGPVGCEPKTGNRGRLINKPQRPALRLFIVVVRIARQATRRRPDIGRGRKHAWCGRTHGGERCGAVDGTNVGIIRSEERRVGEECVGTGRSRG